ncbi:MAG: class II aldolase/adducin family protein [Bacteroidales bacterium]|jgi:L-fuculose-phosphate aldolase|nr:class II aldolase/adducin family protein [Bacteroidales bacterium]MDD4215596.1 class II aldolase/adducin family protein [Bacteroidales bacterium]
MSSEGYQGIKFETVFLQKKEPGHQLLEELKKWCALFHEKNLAPPYPGGSFGNLSFRTENDTFIITGTCIGLKNTLENSCFVEVVTCNRSEKKVYVNGLLAPSSESFMHDEIYKNRPDVGAIFHGHHSLITQNALLLGIPETKEKTPYGTIALADSILEIIKNNNFVVIKEHGFVSVADNIQKAGELTLKWLNKTKLL